MDKVLNVQQNPGDIDVIGSVHIDRRGLSTGLKHISTGFGEYVDDARSEPWVLPYEETLYVISGELTIEAEGRTVVGHAGDIVTAEQGVEMVSYATPGTRVFFASYPRDWRDRQD